MNDFECSPVLLIGFNRPDFMRDQIAAVRVAKPARLYVAVDGPREGRPDEAEKCAEVREAVKLVDWPCEVKMLFREKNLGCKLGVSGAITWFFENEPEGIVLEDDCRPSPDFFRFATEMLARYRDDARIGAVCGFNFYNFQTDPKPSYHFSNHFEVWGWASWRRVWSKYDVEMTPYYEKRRECYAKSGQTWASQYDCLRQIEAAHNGVLNTWDVQFWLAFVANHWLSVVPRERLVRNVGINSGESTHTGGFDQHAHIFARCGKLDETIIHPDELICDLKADHKREYFSHGFVSRIITFAGAKVWFIRRPLIKVCAFMERYLPFAFYW